MGACETSSVPPHGEDDNVHTRRLILSVVAKWLVTLSVASSTYGTLWAYSCREVMVSAKKREFNVVITGLCILLGLITASSLKGMVRALRGWLLSLHTYSTEEAALIRKSDHLSSMIELAWVSQHKSIRAFVLFWLSIHMAAQIAVASVGLTYNVDVSDAMSVTTPGSVLIPDMSVLKPAYSSSKTSLGALRYTAYQLGLYANTLDVGLADDVPRPGAILNSKLPSIFENGTTQFTYVFSETPALDEYRDEVSFLAFIATNRSITTNATCNSYKVLKGGDGWNVSIVIDDLNKTEIYLPTMNGPNQTLYMTDSEQDFTTRWSMISVLEASTTNPWFYRCNCSVGQVVNAVLPQHHVSSLVATLASAGVALQAYGASFSFTNGSNGQDQYQSYPPESWLGMPMEGSGPDVAASVSQFAIGVLAGAANFNPTIGAFGSLPLDSIVLKIYDWMYVDLILGLVIGLQLVLACVVVHTAWKYTRARRLIGLSAHVQVNTVDSKSQRAQHRRKSIWVKRC